MSRRRLLITTGIVSFALLAGWVGAAFVFQPFGQRGWTLATIAVVLTCLAFKDRLRPRFLATPSDGEDRTRRHSLRVARAVLIGALVCWLGLIVWSSLSPGGVMPPPKAGSDTVRVLTWNILRGSERGTPWSRNGWPVRKDALRLSIETSKPDVLCVQEALPEQVESVAGMLPGYRRVGVGRDDGRTAGEHCAIYFDKGRFEELGGDTFWLEEPADAPPSSTLFGPKRICTWVRLRETRSGSCIRIYNLHLYLTESARVRSVRLILDRIARGVGSDAVLVAGDFNSTPDASDRRLFNAAGFTPSAELAGESPDTPTYQFYGIRMRSLDEILVNRGWRVLSRRVLDVKPGNTFPSDHFGVMADLLLREEASSAGSRLE